MSRISLPPDFDTSSATSPISTDSTLSDINLDEVTSTPDTEPDDSSSSGEDHSNITPTEPKLLDDGRYDIMTKNPMKILKRIIREGGGGKPSYEYECRVLYKGKLADGTVFDEKSDKKKPFVFTIGEGSVIPGWEIAVSTMQKRELAEFTIAPEYAYGSAGKPPIPPNATLTFEIELLGFHKEPITHKEKINYSQALKDKGARYVAKGNWDMAFRTYRKAQSDVNDLYHRKAYLKERLRPLKIALHLNVALCSLKLTPPQYRRVVHETTWVLALDPQNTKALYRRGVGEARLMQWESAVRDLEQAARLQPKDELIRRELIAAQNELKKKNDKEKKMFAGLFEKMRNLEEEKKAAEKQAMKQQKEKEKAERKERRKKEKEEKELLKEKVKNLNLEALQSQAATNTQGNSTSPSFTTPTSANPASSDNPIPEPSTQTSINGFTPTHRPRKNAPPQRSKPHHLPTPDNPHSETNSQSETDHSSEFYFGDEEEESSEESSSD